MSFVFNGFMKIVKFPYMTGHECNNWIFQKAFLPRMSQDGNIISKKYTYLSIPNDS